MPVKTIEKGCKICGNDIKGNSTLGYYCKRCNIIYSQHNIDELLKLRKLNKSNQDKNNIKKNNNNIIQKENKAKQVKKNNNNIIQKENKAKQVKKNNKNNNYEEKNIENLLN